MCNSMVSSLHGTQSKNTDISRHVPPSSECGIGEIEHYRFEASHEFDSSHVEAADIYEGQQMFFCFKRRDCCGRLIADDLSLKSWKCSDGFANISSGRPRREMCNIARGELAKLAIVRSDDTGDSHGLINFVNVAQAFENAQHSERKEFVNELEVSLERAIQEGDQIALRQLVCTLCATIAKPRARAVPGAAEPMTPAAEQRLRDALQVRLRRLLKRGLTHLVFSAADAGVDVGAGIAHVQRLIADFVYKHPEPDRGIENAADSSSWLRLSSTLDRIQGEGGKHKNWEVQCAELSAWSQRAGRLPKRGAENEVEQSLAMFLCEVQQQFCANLLSTEQRVILQQVPHIAERIKKWQNLEWDKKYSRFTEWVDSNGRLPKRHADNQDERQIADWLHKMQDQLRAAELTDSRRERLRRVPFMGARMAKWEQRYGIQESSAS